MIIILDHYYLELLNNCYAVVVGNYHSNNYVIGYMKYCPVNYKTIWCNHIWCYERLIKYYMVEEIHGFTPWKTYIAYYDNNLPIIPASMIKNILEPMARLKNIISSPKDKLEYHIVKLVDEIGFVNGLGITGSVLPGIHNTRYSDLDFVVYGLKNSIDIIEFIMENPSLFHEFENDRLREWCFRISRITGLSPNDIRWFYRRWRRGLFHGREYSFIYNDGVLKLVDNMPVWKTIGVIEAEIIFSKYYDALNYPSKGIIEKWSFRKGVYPNSDIEYVLSFEALYMPILYEGGHAIVRGLLQYNYVDDTYRILVGVKETKTFIKPLTGN